MVATSKITGERAMAGEKMSKASDRIEEMMRKFEEQAAKASELQNVVQDLRGSAKSPDGAVSVTVAPSGAVLDLTLTAAAMRQPHGSLQQSIMTTLREATQDASQQLNESVAPVLGEQFGQFQEAFNAQGVTALRPDQSTADSAEEDRARSEAEVPKAAAPPARGGQQLDDDDDFQDSSFLR